MSVDRTATQFFETHEEFMASSLDQNTKNRFLKTQWAPENIGDLNIERCMRIYPHLQDTGGFFVAVLERKKKEPALSRSVSNPDVSCITERLSSSHRKRTNPEAEADEVPEAKRTKVDAAAPAAPVPEAISTAPSVDSAMDTTEDTVPSPAGPSTPKDIPATSAKDKDTGKGKDFKEDPYTYLPDNHPLLKTCLERLQIIPSFPSRNVLVRNTLADTTSNSIRSFYMSNDLVKAVIMNNDYQKLRLTAAGTKVFTKQEAGKGLEAQYRVLGEGLPVVLPFVKPEAILKGNLATLKTFLESYYPLVRTFEEEFRSQIDESCEYLSQISCPCVLTSISPATGSLIVRFPPEEKDGATYVSRLLPPGFQFGLLTFLTHRLTHDLYLPIWKSNVSLSLMIDKKAKSALSLRLFHEDFLLKATNKKRTDNAPAKPTESETPPVVAEAEE